MIEHGAFTIAGIQDVAATVIQAAWRGYRLRQSFKGQKELLILHEKKRKQLRKRPDGLGTTEASSVYTSRDSEHEDKEGQLTSQLENENRLFDSFIASNPYEENNSRFFSGDLNFTEKQDSFEEERSSDISRSRRANNSYSSRDRFPDLIQDERFGNNDVERRHLQQSRGYEENIGLDLHGSDEVNLRNLVYHSTSFENKSMDGVKERESADIRNSKLHQNNLISDRRLVENHRSDENIVEQSTCESEGSKSNGGLSDTTGQSRQSQRGEIKRSSHYAIQQAFDNSSASEETRNGINDVDNTSGGLEKGSREAQVSDVEKNRPDALQAKKKLPKEDRLIENIKHQSPSKQRGISVISTGSSCDSVSPLKPWQIYKRDRQRAVLVRRKIESAIVIQRAFRKHLLKTGSNSPEKDASQKDDLKENNDQVMIEEIAALVIQLNWREYVKKKLLKQRREESRKKEREDAMLEVKKEREDRRY